MTDHQTPTDEEALYTYWQDHVKVELPDQLIERFRHLFIEGIDDSNSPVGQTLARIVSSDLAERDFNPILNRSCYILINHWKHHPRYKEAIPKLIALFETSPTELAYSQTTQSLRELVQRFKKTEQYRGLLKYQTQETNQKSKESCNAESQPLRTFLNRYPFMYEHYILTNDSTDKQRQKVVAMREQQQRQFDINLSQYITHQHLPKNPHFVKNPTLLSEHKLNIAIEQFRGKVDGSKTYRDSAEWFRAHSRLTPCYRIFKKELYEYLTASIDPKYSNHDFNRKLSNQLQNTLSQHDSQRLGDVLLVKTCKKLLDFLVIENSDQSKHYTFNDLTHNLGITPTIGLLLKIVLLCGKVKPYMEQKFSILFKHYEAFTDNTKPGRWLVECLENLNIAFSIHFGTIKMLRI